MLTNLDFIKPGKEWPPRSEETRLERYEANRKLFHNEHAEVFKEQLRRIERVFGNFQEVISFTVVINAQQLISKKTADLLLGEFPEINTRDNLATKKKHQELNALLTSINLPIELYKIALDISRFGEGIVSVGKTEDNSLAFNAVQPSTWFPVVNPANVNEVVYHVIAWPEFKYNPATLREQIEKLHVQVHERGAYTEAVYHMDGNRIGALEYEEKPTSTGLGGFSIFPLQGFITTDSIYGIDDYENINGIVAEAMVRIGQISRILDKHASPSMYGPDSFTEEDENGNWRLIAGNFFPLLPDDDKAPGYLTWDGHLTAAFSQYKELKELLYALSEMGGALLGDPAHTGGNIAEGTMRDKMINPLAKVQRIAANITPTLCEMISALTELSNDFSSPIAPEDITINWFDGLPNNERSDQEVIQMQNGGKATMSWKRSVMQANNMDEDQAEEEMSLMLDEAAERVPTFEVKNAESDDDDGEEDEKQEDIGDDTA